MTWLVRRAVLAPVVLVLTALVWLSLPLWLLGALAGLAALSLALAAWRRARGTVWRFFAFAALVLWLSGPRLVEETRETLPDIGLLVIDQSASMDVGERARQESARLIRRRLATLADRLPVVVTGDLNADPRSAAYRVLTRDRVPDGIPWSAGALVDRAGLKGTRAGGAQVSPLHGNFIVRDGAATAGEIRGLVERCQQEVAERFGVHLRQEIVYLGEFA